MSYVPRYVTHHRRERRRPETRETELYMEFVVLYPGPYLRVRSVKHWQSRASARRQPHAAARGVVVEYMDRARGYTLDVFAQTLATMLASPSAVTTVPRTRPMIEPMMKARERNN